MSILDHFVVQPCPTSELAENSVALKLLLLSLSEDRYRGDNQGDWMVQTLREKTPGVDEVLEPNTGIDNFKSRQNLTDKK